MLRPQSRQKYPLTGGQPTDTWQARKDANLRGIRGQLPAIEKETGTRIVFNDHSKTFAFWGIANQVEIAKALVIANVRQSNSTYTQPQKEYGPLADGPWESIGSFAWPSSEFPPENSLGHLGFPLLNPIRKECNVFIEYDSARSSFIVKGKTDEVSKAIIRIRGVLCQTVAKEILTQRDYLLLNDCKEVRLADYSHVAGSLNDTLSLGKAIQSINSMHSSDRLRPTAQQLKNNVMQTLNKVRWYRGHVTMRAHLGVLNLKQYKMRGDRCNLSVYEDMIQESNFKAEVTEELGDRRLEEQVLSRSRKATDILESSDYFIKSLSDIKPVYIASVVVDVQDGGGDLRITKSWKENDSGAIDPGAPIFDRLDNESKRTILSDVCMTDLTTDLTWQLEISASGIQDAARIPEWAQQLGDWYMKIDTEKARSLQFPFCEFEKNWTGGAHNVARKKALKQRIVWKFDVKPPFEDYQVEISKIQNTKYTPSKVPGSESAIVYEPRWTVDVVNRNWEKLSSNGSMGVGERAEWQADLQTWFSTSLDGNKKDTLKGTLELLELLQRVQDMVRGKQQ